MRGLNSISLYLIIRFADAIITAIGFISKPYKLEGLLVETPIKKAPLPQHGSKNVSFSDKVLPFKIYLTTLLFV